MTTICLKEKSIIGNMKKVKSKIILSLPNITITPVKQMIAYSLPKKLLLHSDKL